MGDTSAQLCARLENIDRELRGNREAIIRLEEQRDADLQRLAGVESSIRWGVRFLLGILVAALGQMGLTVYALVAS